MRATSTLNMNAEIRRPKKESHGRASNEQSKKITVNESINCDVKVEKLFLNHNNLPLVFFFQKWYILISMNCANK